VNLFSLVLLLELGPHTRLGSPQDAGPDDRVLLKDVGDDDDDDDDDDDGINSPANF